MAADPPAERRCGECGSPRLVGANLGAKSLARLEEGQPVGASPIAAYFRSLGTDTEGFWRSYRANLLPYFTDVFGREGEAAILELAGGSIYAAVPGASGPPGWRRLTDADLAKFKPEIRRLAVSLWLPPGRSVEDLEGADVGGSPRLVDGKLTGVWPYGLVQDADGWSPYEDLPFSLADLAVGVDLAGVDVDLPENVGADRGAANGGPASGPASGPGVANYAAARTAAAGLAAARSNCIAV